VDATTRQQQPGTLYLIEPDLSHFGDGERMAVDAHSLNPVSVIQLAQSIGELKAKLYLIGCEPAVLENEDGSMGLSECVQAAVPEAIKMIGSLIGELLAGTEKTCAAATA
jgi:hydrogenase maturation protease